MDSLTFEQLRKVNVERCEDSFFPLDHWTGSDWGLAVGGETGEAAEALATAILGLFVTGKSGQALNAVKKLNRGDGDLEDVGKELADMVIYADLLAARLGIDLELAIVEKFNEVSRKRGSSVMIPINSGTTGIFRVLWTDAKHPEPQVIGLRFDNEFRANLCAEQIAKGSPGVKVWVEQETTAARPDAA